MTNDQLIALIDRLRSYGKEKDWFEFKENNSDPHRLGENLAAVANSACLSHEPFGHIVFGIRNSDLHPVGSKVDVEQEKDGGQALLLWLAKLIVPDVALEYFACDYHGAHLVVLRVRSAHGHPVSFKGQASVRIGSNTTNLKDHPQLERVIWNSGEDWSAKVHPTATLLDLDDAAIDKARREFKNKSQAKAEEVGEWSTGVFLDKAHLTIQGGITQTALLLLGKPEVVSLLSPAIAQVSWFLKTDRNEDLDYAHFGPPFILSVDQVLAKVRNLKVRSLPSGTLFPKERDRYDPWVLREALHNCIAHQDYHRRERILCIEKEGQLRFENVGAFIPHSIEDVLHLDTPPSVYRNPFLARAMVSLNMIDTQGGGIRKMFLKQQERAFAMPDYDLSDPSRVKLSLEGEILDEAYTRLLLDRTDLELDTVLLLDKVQRTRRISKPEHELLKDLDLVEGRYPSLFVSGPLARLSGEEVRHVRNRGLNSAKVRSYIYELVEKHPGVSREKIDELVVEMLPAVLDAKTKKSRVHNHIQWRVREGRIHNKGGRGTSSKWHPGTDPEKQQTKPLLGTIQIHPSS